MIKNLTRESVLATEEVWAKSVQERTRGLLDWESIEEGQALVIAPCNSVHMFGMAFPIDVLFLDKDHVVVRAIECLKPWRLTRIYFSARYTVELPVGTIARSGTRKGDRLALDTA